MKDDENNLKIGDVVSARPSGECVSYEGIAVSVMDDMVVVDFGDNEEPSVIPRNHVLRVRSGEAVEKGDIVQAKVDSPVYCIGKVIEVNDDGTFDIGYEGTDEVDMGVPLHCLRKVSSGRSSAFIKMKKAVNTITIARAFATSTGSWGLKPKEACDTEEKKAGEAEAEAKE